MHPKRSPLHSSALCWMTASGQTLPPDGRSANVRLGPASGSPSIESRASAERRNRTFARRCYSGQIAETGPCREATGGSSVGSHVFAGAALVALPVRKADNNALREVSSKAVMNDDRVERRLAAILAADVAGYSRLMGIDEEGTLAGLKGHRRAVIDPKITEHRGRIVKTTGDGFLVEFPSVVDAVRCAVDIQRQMAERNAAVPAERRIEFRVGLNVGDIIIDDTDIYGDGVNIAARLEGLAAPGGICVSRTVRDQVRDKLDFSFEDMGEQQVKNIARPVRTHRVLIDTAAQSESVSSVPSPARPLPQKPSIAVLPFANMSGDAEQEYFSDEIGR